jgi:hypothetical protein
MRIPRVIKNLNCSPILPRQPIHPAGQTAHTDIRELPVNPTVECVKEGDTIRYIDVHCGCGHVTRLVCEYDTPHANSSPTS